MGIVIGLICLAVLGPAVIGLLGVLFPLVLAVITLPLQLLGVMAEDGK